jgi:ligand-binding SRPBCC domain-containing protein
MPHFTRTLELPGVSAERLWAFHERPDALQLLVPPGDRVEVLQPPTSLEVGTKVVLRTYVGPIGFTVTAEHVEYERGHMFADRMSGGPFKQWLHRHIIEPTPTGSRLTDDIEYQLIGGPLGNAVGGPIARRRLDKMFDHRHAVTRELA